MLLVLANHHFLSPSSCYSIKKICPHKTSSFNLCVIRGIKLFGENNILNSIGRSKAIQAWRILEQWIWSLQTSTKTTLSNLTAASKMNLMKPGGGGFISNLY